MPACLPPADLKPCLYSPTGHAPKLSGSRIPPELSDISETPDPAGLPLTCQLCHCGYEALVGSRHAAYRMLLSTKGAIRGRQQAATTPQAEVQRCLTPLSKTSILLLGMSEHLGL